MGGMRICRKGQGFRVSISLDEEKVPWLLDAFVGFY